MFIVVLHYESEYVLHTCSTLQQAENLAGGKFYKYSAVFPKSAASDADPHQQKPDGIRCYRGESWHLYDLAKVLKPNDLINTDMPSFERTDA